jgi:NitT/TauT family transport system permease protein/taurine transport system permease protein
MAEARGRAAAGRVVECLAPFAVVVLLWQASAMLLAQPATLYPRPAGVAAALADLVRRGILVSYTVTSLERWVLAVAGAIVVALPVSLVFAFSRRMNAAVMPVVRYFTSVAELAWLPLLVLSMGYAYTTGLLVIGYTVFFPVLLNIMLGFQQVPEIMLYAVQTLGATRGQTFREVLLPGALPGLVTGIRIGAGYAFRSLIAAEIASSANADGLGYMIFSALQDRNTDRMIVGMIVLGLLWLGIDRLYLRPIEAATLERWGLLRRPG